METPGFLSKYFWDVNLKGLDTSAHPFFVIERILEYGDEKAVKWMRDNFSKSQIKQTLSKRKGFSKKSVNYWSLILGVPRSKVLCLSRSYQKTRKNHWPY